MRAWLAQLATEAPDWARTREFRRLQAAWYARLEREGFADAEYACQAHYTGALPRAFDAHFPTQEFYRLAAWWRWDRVWPDRRSAMMWAALAEGATYREIAEAGRLTPGISRTQVWRLLQQELPVMRAHYGADGTADAQEDDHA